MVQQRGQRWALWVWVLVGAAFILRCVLILENAGSSQALALATPDDSYYYFVPLRNVINGYGISFDGINPTNGFHPLWFFVLVPVFAVFLPAGPDVPIVIALFIGSACTVMAGYFLWRAVRRVTGHALAAGVVLVLFLFNPYIVSASFNGLETGLHLLCVAALLELLSRLYTQADFPRGDVLRLGMWVGLVFLSRTDTVILLAVLMVFLFLARPTPTRFMQMGVAGVIALLIAAPWLLWNYRTFGSVIQSSGVPLTLNAQRRFEVLTNGADPLPERLILTGHYIRMGLRYAGFSLVAVLVLVVPLLVLFITSRRRRPRKPFLSGAQARWLVIAAVYGRGYIAFNALVRWIMRDWYFATVLVVFYVALGVLLARFVQVTPLKRWLGGEQNTENHTLFRGLGRVLLVGGLLLALVSFGWLEELSQTPNNPAFRFWGNPVRYPGQDGMYRAVQWINANTPPASPHKAQADGWHVGSFNTGILAYYAHRPITNLDGLMNHAVQPYIARHLLLCYFEDARLDYIADFKNQFSDWESLFSPDLSVTAAGFATTYTPVFEDDTIPPAGYFVVRLEATKLRTISLQVCGP